jgi:hypothetical protein
MQTLATYDVGSAVAQQVESSRQLSLPTRIITYAWGQKYLDKLLSLTLPALLAPGNLPYVAEKVPCKVVILTEEKFFDRLRADLAVVRMQELCPLQMVALDDLISHPDKYGMALTYALHRGFADLGPAVTDGWLMFLNADFILADGSLRTLIGRLSAGERLVASPSYCVNSEQVTPLLLRRVDPQSRVLSLSPRELATLVLQHRHNTIRAKTVNRPLFSIRYMDQFYWEVDNHTLLGRQMPIAIVGMRPERHLVEPNSYWDHGLMREFVPTAAPCVIGDSDDFVMLELRPEQVAEDQLRFGWREPGEIARNTISFLTAYQRGMAKYPIALHDRDLPAGTAEAHQRLRDYVDQVLAHTPKALPSHLNHPQWNYHQPAFIRSRHEYLSDRLGLDTIGSEPPADLGELDRLWWKLDGCKKAHQQRRSELEAMRDHQRAAVSPLQHQLDEWIKSGRDRIDRSLVSQLSKLPVGSASRCLDGDLRRWSPVGEGEPDKPAAPLGWAPAQWMQPFERHSRAWTALDAEVRSRAEAVSDMSALLEARCEAQLAMLDLEFEQASRQLQSDYDRQLERRVTSAAIPAVAIERGPQPNRPPASWPFFERIAWRIYNACFGARARMRQLHPQWAPMRPLVRLVNQLARDGAADVLVVGDGGIADTAANTLHGIHARVSKAEAFEGNLAAAFNQEPQFDLCLCTIAADDIACFAELVVEVAPCMRSGARVVGFYPNLDLLALPAVDARLLRGLYEGPGGVRVHFAGSAESARLLTRFRKVLLSVEQRGRLLGYARIVACLVFLAPRAWLANRREELEACSQQAVIPDPCTSLMIEVVL